MIETQVKAHDKFSVEIKTGFRTDNTDGDINQFKINTWIFLPNGLDINRETYTKEQFYKDIKTNIRLITPIYSLEDILKTGRGPLPRLQKAIENLIIEPLDEVKKESYLYQVKMFVCIVKSALRRDSEYINITVDEAEILRLTNQFIHNIKAITIQYREKWSDIDIPEIELQQKEYFHFGDDFLSNITEQYSFLIMRSLKGKAIYEAVKPELEKLILDENKYRKHRGFMLLEEDNEEHNSIVISQRNVLKKFVESDLFLQVLKKKDGAFVQQIYYSIAAGLAMIFATVISFFATQRYGNFTTDLFIALVLSYMMKDRIKEMMRYYFASELSKRYFDTKLKLSIRKQEIGNIRESFDFIDENKTPQEILNLRNRTPLVEAENQIYDEKIIRYRKWVTLSKDEIEEYKEYRLSGVNDITRFSLFNFILKMDNPHIPLYILDQNEGVKTFKGTRVYPLYFILQCESDNDIYYRKYRVLFNRNGITSISKID